MKVERATCHDGSVYRLETGKRKNPRMDVLEKLARALEVDAGYLIITEKS